MYMSCQSVVLKTCSGSHSRAVIFGGVEVSDTGGQVTDIHAVILYSSLSAEVKVRAREQA